MDELCLHVVLRRVVILMSLMYDTNVMYRLSRTACAWV